MLVPTAMTARVSCRSPLCALGSLQLGNWARETSDRGGQDKARKVRAVGRGEEHWEIPAIQQTLHQVSRTLRLSTMRYDHSAFNTP
jgi:hypothetical protein